MGESRQVQTKYTNGKIEKILAYSHKTILFD